MNGSWTACAVRGRATTLRSTEGGRGPFADGTGAGECPRGQRDGRGGTLPGEVPGGAIPGHPAIRELRAAAVRAWTSAGSAHGPAGPCSPSLPSDPLPPLPPAGSHLTRPVQRARCSAWGSGASMAGRSACVRGRMGVKSCRRTLQLCRYRWHSNVRKQSIKDGREDLRILPRLRQCEESCTAHRDRRPGRRHHQEGQPRIRRVHGPQHAYFDLQFGALNRTDRWLDWGNDRTPGPLSRNRAQGAQPVRSRL